MRIVTVKTTYFVDYREFVAAIAGLCGVTDIDRVEEIAIDPDSTMPMKLPCPQGSGQEWGDYDSVWIDIEVDMRPKEDGSVTPTSPAPAPPA